MEKQTKKQNGFGLLIAIIIIAVGIIIIAIAVSAKKGSLPSPQNTNTQQTTQQGTKPSSQSAPTIQNAGDLDAVGSGLDNTNLDVFDKELDQLSKDSSTF